MGVACLDQKSDQINIWRMGDEVSTGEWRYEMGGNVMFARPLLLLICTLICLLTQIIRTS
jgi:hypothetical protein